MCIVIIKPINVKFPTEDVLRNCFENNPHGAGFMYCKNKQVHIKKGFMTFDAFRDALASEALTTKDLVIMHFRIMTAGDIKPAHCHPFPISGNIKDLEATNIIAKAALAHNGIIDIESGNISDTMVFVRDILSKINYKDKTIFKLIKMATSESKLAILTGKGKLFTTGNWIKNSHCYYSNSSYEKAKIDISFSSWKEIFTETDKDKFTETEDKLSCLSCGAIFSENEMDLEYTCPDCKSDYIQYMRDY